MNAIADADVFEGTNRFTVQRCLGAGSFGTVYEVFDRERGASVALKVLRQPDPTPSPLAPWERTGGFLSRPREALVEGRKALELDPFNSLFHILLGTDLVYARRWDDAIAEANFSLRSVPGDPAAHCLLWWANVGKGRLGEAVAGARGYTKFYGDPRIDAAFEKGEKEGGYRLAMARAAEATATLFRESYANPTDVAMLWIGAGDHAQAMDWLEKGYEVRDQNMPYLGLPMFDPLRSNPRFQALVRKMNLPAG